MIDNFNKENLSLLEVRSVQGSEGSGDRVNGKIEGLRDAESDGVVRNGF